MPSQENVIFSGQVGQLEGILHLPDMAPKAIAVVAHPLPVMGGTMNNKVVTTLSKALLESGFATLRFNFRGVGHSIGSYDEGLGEVDDAIAAAEFMRTRFPDLPLFCAGFSFGGYVQACAATVLHPKQLILIAPAVSRFAMPVVSENTVVIQGDLDEIIGLDDVLQWARPQHLPVTVLTNATHFFHGRLPQLKQIVLERIEKNL